MVFHKSKRKRRKVPEETANEDQTFTPASFAEYSNKAALEERIKATLALSRSSAVGLVFAEVTAGLTFCRVAEMKDKGSPKHLEGIRLAKEALRIAEKYMWMLQMSHPEFDQMMAMTERLKFEVANLESNHQ